MLHGLLLLLVMPGWFVQAARPVPQHPVARVTPAKKHTGFQFLPSSWRYLQRTHFVSAQKAQTAQNRANMPRPSSPASARLEIPVCGTFSEAVLVLDGQGVHFEKVSSRDWRESTTRLRTESSQ
jgi:hypothetical protein